jgi:2-hydroxycyclohexanecarboxyl-CoA dehydrogenase
LRDEARFRGALAELVTSEPVSGLVNCAGIFPVEKFVESDSASWRAQIDVNFLAPIIACQEVVPRLIEAGWGRIVNITSDSSRSGAARLAVYAGTKGGLLSFSKSLAQELGRAGVTVNCVSPGTIETQATDKKMAEKIARNIPLGRLGTPDDVAPAVAFLMGEGARYITGQVLSVGGGLTMIG